MPPMQVVCGLQTKTLGKQHTSFSQQFYLVYSSIKDYQLRKFKKSTDLANFSYRYIA